MAVYVYVYKTVYVLPVYARIGQGIELRPLLLTRAMCMLLDVGCAMRISSIDDRRQLNSLAETGHFQFFKIVISTAFSF